MVVVDELGSGVAPASAPELARDLGVAPGLAAGVIIAAFHSLALFVEAPLLAWADRGRVGTVSAVALAALGTSLLLAALAPGPLVLFAALALYGPASGVALAASEGLLVESRPHERERTMARLTLAGALGDLGVPAMLAVLASVGLGWRTATCVGGAAAFLLAIVHARSRELHRPMAFHLDAADDDAEPARPPMRELLHTVRSTPALVAWSVAGPAVNLLDEVLVAFAVVHLDGHTHATAIERSAAVAAWTSGGLAGLLVLDRVLSRGRPLVLLACAVATLVPALLVVALTRSPSVAIAALAIVGAAGATLHPITQARAYAALPGRPALVNAVGSLLAPLDLALPVALSFVALRCGSVVAMLVLISAPLVVGLAAFVASGAAEAPTASDARSP